MGIILAVQREASGVEAPTVNAMNATNHYVIRGGQDGKRRLEILARTLWPTTFQLLKRIGVRRGMTCLDLGCGGGDVTMGIARLVGVSGRVVGMDMDSIKLALAREEAARQGLSQVEFRDGNVLEWSEERTYDLIYARFLLTHLRDREAVVGKMRQALKPGGVLAVEDIDFTGYFCHPKNAAFDRYVELYREVVLRRGGDPDIGPKLHGLLLDAGLQSVNLHLVQPVHLDQEGKEICLSTLVNIAEAVLSERLAEESELSGVIAELERFTADPTSVVSFPRVFQGWARRA
jgi:2-polyprenyl-3-methyl-5-hydroxy-6-metoxy-1,4-benzoquinol methylase